MTERFTSITPAPGPSIGSLVLAQAARCPDAIAIGAPGRAPLGYDGLAAQLRETAGALRAAGIGRGDVVAMSLPNGPEAATAFLAVAACATSAPLNPAYRTEECEFYLADLGARALLVLSGEESPAVAVARARGIPVLAIQPCTTGEAGRFRIDGAGCAPATVDLATSDDIALVLHTSGTTSRPKVVPLSHANLCASARAIAEHLALAGADRCLNVMPLFHIHGLIGALLSSITAGSSIACTPGFLAPRFFGWLDECEPTWYTAVPTIHQAVLTRAEQAREIIARRPLRFIRSSSSALPPQTLAALQQAFGAPVVEAYGMTEASHQMASNPLPPGRRKPGSVGRAAGPEVAIMDGEGALLPSGTRGEVVIRGPSVTSGYRDNPSANASAFTGGWFRTGDEGHLDAEGYLYLTGRLKEIINRGGEKISPREIDECLMDHPAVAQAVAFAVPHDTLGEDVGVAVVPRSGAVVSAAELRRFVAARLAHFKVPAVVRILDEIPKGPTGKPQRIGLAAALGITAEPTPAPTTAGYVEPATPTERRLVGLVAEVVGVERVGTADNFFALGGDSMLAGRLASRVRDEMGLELPLLALSEFPTLADLAARIDAGEIARADDEVRPIIAAGGGGSAVASFAQQRMWLLDQLADEPYAYNRPLALAFTGPLDGPALGRALGEIVRRHEVLRTVYASTDGELTPRLRPAEPVPMDVVDLRDASPADRDERARAAVVAASHERIDLERGPVARATLVRTADDEHILVTLVHHIAFDGWSVGVLLRELAPLYEAYAAGRPSPLPPLSIQYADFGRWEQERQRRAPELVERQLAHWREQLAGAPRAIRLRVARPDGAPASVRGGRVAVPLSRAECAALTTVAQREGATTFMMLLAAFAVVLRDESGAEDLVIGTTTTGRVRPELEPLIGFFANTLPLRVRLDGDPTVRELLARVRAAALGGFANQDAPFEQVVDAMRGQEEGVRAPLVQYVCQLRGGSTTGGAMGPVRMGRYDFDSGIARFDLAFDAEEREDGLHCWLLYRAGVLDRPEVARMAERLRRVIADAVADPLRRVSELAAAGVSMPDVARPHARVDHADTPAGRVSPYDPDLLELYERSNLSMVQLLVWLGHRLRPRVPLYSLPFLVPLPVEVEPQHFARAFATVVRSADALHTVVSERADGTPWMVARPEMAAELPIVDLSGEADPQAATRDWLERHVRHTFDLADRLFDAALLRRGDADWLFYINLHHIATDGRSIFLGARMISELYEQSLRNELPERLTLPSFHEHVRAERANRGSAETAESEAYWAAKLEAAHERPSFYGGGSTRSGTAVTRIRRALGPERSAVLRALAARIGSRGNADAAGGFAVSAAVLAAFVHRVGGVRRIAIGVPYHNRRDPERRTTIGLFMHVLPLFVEVRSGDSFAALARSVADEIAGLQRHGRVAIGNSPQQPAYDVLLNFHSYQRAFIERTGAAEPWWFARSALETRWLHAGHEEDALALQVHDKGDAAGYVLDFDLHTEAFDASSREMAVDHYFQLLDAALADPDRPVDDVDLSSPAEREARPARPAAPPAPVIEHTIAELFEIQARRTPDNPAVVAGAASLTYRELDRRAERLARELARRGVGPDVPVALFVERSLDMAVALLGVLKAGGAYLPLDLGAPAERIGLMLAESAAPVLLTQQSLLGRLPAHAASVLCMDAMPDEPPGAAESVRIRRARPDDLAYIIYTSGSTGAPKGVMVPHRAVVNHNREIARVYRLDEHDQVLHMHPISFDFSVEEIFPVWLRGGAVVLAPEGPLSPAEITGLVEREQVTVLLLATAFWHAWADDLVHTARAVPGSLRLIATGGEEALPERLAAFRRHAGQRIRWINSYGPTEAAVSATVYEPPADDAAWRTGLPIGRPLPNVEAYVLDDRGRAAPAGVPGELFLGGIGLARGYLGQPEMTAERFVRHPFSSAPDARLYRTGDRARLRSDGELEFLGRMDDQVKLNGYRVELGEVDAVLRAQPGVRDAVAIVREDDGVGRRLVAYVVPADALAPPLPGAVARGLRDRLPAYMVPSAIVPLERLPVTSSGKLDRRALPAPIARAEDAPAIVAPRTGTERDLAAIWGELLGNAQIGIHDDFFELGGHSLLAGRVMARVRDRMGAELPLRAIFDGPTIAQLAERIQGALGGANDTRAGAPAIAAVPRAERRLTRSADGLASRPEAADGL